MNRSVSFYPSYVFVVYIYIHTGKYMLFVIAQPVACILACLSFTFTFTLFEFDRIAKFFAVS